MSTDYIRCVVHVKTSIANVDEEGEERLSFTLLCAAFLKKGCMPYVFEEVPVSFFLLTIDLYSLVRHMLLGY